MMKTRQETGNGLVREAAWALGWLAAAVALSCLADAARSIGGNEAWTGLSQGFKIALRLPLLILPFALAFAKLLADFSAGRLMRPRNLAARLPGPACDGSEDAPAGLLGSAGGPRSCGRHAGPCGRHAHRTAVPDARRPEDESDEEKIRGAA